MNLNTGGPGIVIRIRVHIFYIYRHYTYRRSQNDEVIINIVYYNITAPVKFYSMLNEGNIIIIYIMRIKKKSQRRRIGASDRPNAYVRLLLAEYNENILQYIIAAIDALKCLLNDGFMKTLNEMSSGHFFRPARDFCYGFSASQHFYSFFLSYFILQKRSAFIMITVDAAWLLAL